MALPVVVVQEEIADKLIAAVVEKAKQLKIGPGYLRDTDMGPVISKDHKQSVINWINKGIEEGAKLVLDGRAIQVPGGKWLLRRADHLGSRNRRDERRNAGNFRAGAVL